MKNKFYKYRTTLAYLANVLMLIGLLTLFVAFENKIKHKSQTNLHKQNTKLELILKAEEGFSSTPYICSEGYITIGYGTRLHDQKGMKPTDFHLVITREVARLWLKEKISKIKTKITTSKQNEVFKNLSPNRKAIILSMAYQMGTSGILKFKKMWKALSNKNWKKAREEALNSKWARQTPERANRHATILAGADLRNVY